MSKISLKKKLDKGADIDMKNKSIINLDLPSNQVLNFSTPEQSLNAKEA